MRPIICKIQGVRMINCTHGKVFKGYYLAYECVRLENRVTGQCISAGRMGSKPLNPLMKPCNPCKHARNAPYSCYGEQWF